MSRHYTDEHIEGRPINPNGLIVRRKGGTIHTNIPHTAELHSPDGFEVGYSGSGPADLALNTVEYALLTLDDEGVVGVTAPTDSLVRRGTAMEETMAVYQQFKDTFIAPMDDLGGEVPWDVIKAWLLSQKEILRADPDSLAERVRTVGEAVLYNESELDADAQEPPEGAVVVESVQRTFAFHAGRLEQHTDEIRKLVDEIPDNRFRPTEEGGGGGCSFLALAETKNGQRWAEHPTMGLFCALACAVGMGAKLPIDADVLPGGVPYFQFSPHGVPERPDMDHVSGNPNPNR